MQFDGSQQRASLSADEQAVLGMPLNISIAMLILLFSFPLAYGGLHTYGLNAAQAEVEEQVSLLYQVAEVVYLSEENAPAAEMSLTLEFSSRAMVDLERVRIGADLSGQNAGDADHVDYVLDGGQHFVLNSRMSIPLMADDDAGGEDGELLLTPGKHKLRLVLVVATNEQGYILDDCPNAAGSDMRFVCIQEVS
jgi:hypothetical protein